MAHLKVEANYENVITISCLFLLFPFLPFSFFSILVTCYATLHPALSVHPSNRPSVGPSHFTFLGFAIFGLTDLPKCSGDLKRGPCPPARNWSSRVSALVFLMIFFFQDNFTQKCFGFIKFKRVHEGMRT